MNGGKFIETVFIPDMIGPRCACRRGGLQNELPLLQYRQAGLFSGQLSPADIMNQMQSIPETDKLTNVVFMGMGEPMDNVETVLQVLKVMTADYGYGWSPKRITVSSVGVLPGLRRFLQESECHLAISLHNPFPDERESIMPIQKAYPIQEVIDEIKNMIFGPAPCLF